MLTRPENYQALPDPPDPSEALAEDFAVPSPPPCSSPTVLVSTEIEWFYDDPTIVVDQGCDIANGVSLTDLDGPAFNEALASPAAHIEGSSEPALASGAFTLAVEAAGDLVHVTLTPRARAHQALFAAKVTATWSCGP